ncbi:MAG: helix-turn-helix domain-containing protein [Reyranellaceae bacterium]
MNETAALALLAALGQPVRLALLRQLLDAWPQAVASGALARLCDAPPTTVSGHLGVLARAGLVRAERAGTTIHYRATPAALRRLMAFLARDCCGDRRDLLGSYAGLAVDLEDAPVGRGPQAACSVLFLGVRNAGRSILAEALLRKRGGGRFAAFSAGLAPARRPLPEVLSRLRRLACDTTRLASKPVTDFLASGAPPLDAVIVVGTLHGGATLPSFAGTPVVVAWPMPDPAAYRGPVAEQIALLDQVVAMLRQRIDALVGLSLDSLDRAGLAQALAAIGNAPMPDDLAVHRIPPDLRSRSG